MFANRNLDKAAHAARNALIAELKRNYSPARMRFDRSASLAERVAQDCYELNQMLRVARSGPVTLTRR
jgi:hypothetical protein